MTVNFDYDAFLRSLDYTETAVKDAAKKGMEDCVDDLQRTAIDAAPIDKGQLRRSTDKRIYYRMNDSSIVGEVSFSAVEHGFNYALWTHEMAYNLGEKSLQAPGGIGMSGSMYHVGNKYLERPAQGEAETYKKHIAEVIRGELT